MLRYSQGFEMTTEKSRKIAKAHQQGSEITLAAQDAFEFLTKLEDDSVDLIVSSPPYYIGKEYDRSLSVADFLADHAKLIPLLFRVLRVGGSLCWQVGHHVDDGVVIPLDALVYQTFSQHRDLYLRNRIVWTFGHGTHAKRRFSGRHETILWFSKGDDYYFDLDQARVPQKYPGKRHYKGSKKGQWSGNPLGKNPSDVWDIPNVKAGHVEKTEHPCQFPVALVRRLIRTLSPAGGLVLDPFMGAGSTAVAALLEGRRFCGSELHKKYVRIAEKRVSEVQSGKIRFRPDTPVFIPTGNEAVSVRPPHFVVHL